MAGSHRNEEIQPGLASKAPMVAIIVGVLGIIGFVVWTLVQDEAEPLGGTNGMSTSSPVPTPSSSPSAVSPIDDLPQIAPSPPKRLVIGDKVAARFDRSVEVQDDLLEARSGANLSRVGSRGEPGSPGEDTVVIVGQDRFDRKAALNDIGEVEKGDKIRVITADARLIYTVDSAFSIASDNVTSSSLFTDKRPGRLLLVGTTYSDSGNRTGADTLIVAQLTAARTR